MKQTRALSILKTGANVFLTGEPGSGKTYIICEYVSYLRTFGIDPAITASTGIAATHIHGQTIHSWSGIGVRSYLSEYDLDTIANKEHVVRRIRSTKVLIIDEISMLSGQMLDMVDQVCRVVKQQSAPFGGIQVILVGDFFQLPPIVSSGNHVSFAFHSSSWRALDLVTCYLSEQHRQEDKTLLSLLSAIRRNAVLNDHHLVLQSRMIGDDVLPEGITKLFTKNIGVDAVNDRAIERIIGKAYTYDMETKGGKLLVESLKKGCLSPERLTVKKGAVVMCTKNNPGVGYVNGTLGTVIDIEPTTNYPIIRTHTGEQLTITPVDWTIEEDGKIRARITQIPLRLAWAITIHKSQGMSMDGAVIDLTDVFEYGQGYVALSRVRTLSGLHLYGYNEQALKVHPEILRVDAVFRSSSEEADRAFGMLEGSDLATMYEQFIKAIGGSRLLQKKNSEPKKTTLEETKELFSKGNDVVKIAALRSLTIGTVLDHLEELSSMGAFSKDELWGACPGELKKKIPHIHTGFEALGSEKLAPIHVYFKGKYSYDELKIARLLF